MIMSFSTSLFIISLMVMALVLWAEDSLQGMDRKACIKLGGHAFTLLFCGAFGMVFCVVNKFICGVWI